METKSDAIRRARKIRARLKTRGWKIKVWENIGWCWSLDHLDGHFVLFECKHTKTFSTLLSIGDYVHTGSENWLVRDNFTDPNKAVEAQLQAARSYAKRISAWVNNLKKIA